MPAIRVHLLGPGDAGMLERVAAGVFDNAVDPVHCAAFLADSRHHMVVALEDGVVVGMASAVHYVHPDKPDALWINEVGVGNAYLRRGIGKQLMLALLDRGRELGCTEAWLGTERENEAARALYRSTGGQEDLMVYVTFDLTKRP